MTKKIGNKIMEPKRKAIKKKKAAKKKAAKKSSKKATKKRAVKKSPWHIDSEQAPTAEHADDYGRVLVWDGLMAMPRSFEQVDHDMLWSPMPANPTAADLAKVEAAKQPGAGA